MAKSTWALLNLAKTLNAKFEKDWKNIPFDERRAWAKLVLMGLLAVLAVLFGSIGILRTLSGGANHFAWEETVLRSIETAPVGFATAVWIQTFGADFMLVFVVLTTAALAVWNDRPLLGVTILMSLVVMDAVVRVGWFSYVRHRPEIIAQGLASPGLHSFPSGHTSKTLAVYGLLAAQWFYASRSTAEKTLIVLLTMGIAVMVPYGRMRMGVHWPMDVLGGLLIGGVWLAFMIAAVRHERLKHERSSS
jgi:undecaprenyl-diphosphatase